MYDKKLLQKLGKKYERKAAKALMKYQETGSEKYDREAEEAEIIAAALRAALDDRPHDTRLSKLLRQYPKAKAECIKEYYSCPAYLGYNCPEWADCKGCWDVPVEEEQE